MNECLFNRLKAKSILDVSGCWLWRGKKVDRYGTISLKCDGVWKTRSAHRVMWEAVNGPIPDGMCVLHRCDVPSCVCPDHLWIGTMQDNSSDCVTKGRWGESRSLSGEDNPTAKLSEKDVLEIRSSSETQRVLSCRFKVAQSLISNIIHYKKWSHVA